MSIKNSTTVTLLDFDFNDGSKGSILIDGNNMFVNSKKEYNDPELEKKIDHVFENDELINLEDKDDKAINIFYTQKCDLYKKLNNINTNIFDDYNGIGENENEY